jgi:hypothetical protein
MWENLTIKCGMWLLLVQMGVSDLFRFFELPQIDQTPYVSKRYMIKKIITKQTQAYTI